MTRTHRTRLPRREFLGGLGAAALATPLIPLLQSHAASGEVPKRLILLCSSNGTIRDQWLPGFDGDALTLGPVLAPLEEHKDRLLVLDGLGWDWGDGPGIDHMRIAMLWSGTPMLEGDEFHSGDGALSCGWGGGTSIDQFIGRELAAPTPFTSLEFGVQNGDAHIYSRVNYAGPNQPLPPEDDPYAMFDRLFADLGHTQAELERIRAQRRSVLDAVTTNLDAVQGKVASEDRLKIEAHLEAIRAIEKRLDLTTVCDVPMLGDHLDPDANDNFPTLSRLQIDLMVLAMTCDMTRIASLLWGRAGSVARYTWLGQSDAHHTISHDPSPTARQQVADVNTWHAAELAYLLDALAAVPEGDGTMLDNTLVVWGNELADGLEHSQHPIPFVLAGNLGGALQTGRYLNYDWSRHNRLLVSVCQLMGVDVQSYGSLDDGSGGLDGLT